MPLPWIFLIYLLFIGFYLIKIYFSYFLMNNKTLSFMLMFSFMSINF